MGSSHSSLSSNVPSEPPEVPLPPSPSPRTLPTLLAPGAPESSPVTRTPTPNTQDTAGPSLLPELRPGCGRGAAPGSLLFQNFPVPSITRHGQGLLIEPGCCGPVSRVYEPGLDLAAKLLRMRPASAAPSPPRPIAAPSGSRLRCAEAEPAPGRGQERAVVAGRAWGQPAMPGVTAARRVSRMFGKFLGLDRTQGGGNLPTTSGGRCLSCPQCPRNVEESPPGTGLSLQGHLRTRAPARPRACAEGRWCGWRRAGVGPRAAGPGLPGHRLRARGGRPGSVLPTASERRGQIPSAGPGPSSLHSSWASEGSGLIRPQPPDGVTWRCPSCGVHWLGTKFPKPISSFFCACN